MQTCSGLFAEEAPTLVSSPSSNTAFTSKDQFPCELPLYPSVQGLTTHETFHDRQRLILTPDKLKACVSLVNKMHSISLQAGEGKLPVLMGYASTPGASALCPLYFVWYNGPEERTKELAAPIYALEPAHAIGGMSNYADTTQVSGSQ